MEHKCDSCGLEFATCPARNIVWGIDRDPSARGADADRVLECDSYRPSEAALSARVAELEAENARLREAWTMTQTEKNAFEWAEKRMYQSVSASYARILATYIRRALSVQP